MEGQSLAPIAIWWCTSGSSQTYGIRIVNGFTVYADGFQLELGSYATHLAHGDLMDVGWNSTAHASTSGRTAARIRQAVSETVNLAEGTISASIRMNQDMSDLTSVGPVIFEEDTGELSLWWNDGAQDWSFSDGTTTITSTGTAVPSVNDVLHFHATWDPVNGLALYLNGSSIATSGTYTPPTLGTYLYIGTSDSVTRHINATYMGFSTYKRAMTAAEVLADYNNIVEMTNDNSRVETVPWLWTDGGTDQVDNCLDSTRSHYAVCGGVPGSIEAETFIRALGANRFDTTTSGVWLSLIDVDDFIDPLTLLFLDGQGTVKANYCGGETHRQASLSTTAVAVRTLAISDAQALMELEGREFFLITRVDPNANTLMLAARISVGDVTIDTDFRNASGVATECLCHTDSVVFPILSGFIDEYDGNQLTHNVSLLAKRSSGTADLDTDFFQLFPRPFMKVVDNTSTATGFATDGGKTIGIASGAGGKDFSVKDAGIPPIGDTISLAPNKINLLTVFQGDNDVDPVITETIDYIIRVTPRYSLL
jgi:hypothetical protein